MDIKWYPIVWILFMWLFLSPPGAGITCVHDHFYGTEDWTQDFVLAGQALFRLSCIPSPSCDLIFMSLMIMVLSISVCP